MLPAPAATNGTRNGFTHILIATKKEARGRFLRAALDSEPGFHVLGQISDWPGIMALTSTLKPDILVLDSALGCNLNGCAQSLSGVRVILLAPVIDRARVLDALRLAARGILPAVSPPQALARSIRRVMEGRYSIDAEAVAVLVQMLREVVVQEAAEASPPTAGLTPRERDVVGMVAQGNSNKRIAQTLCISERTVKHHLTAVFDKLRLSSRLELAIYAPAHGLTSARISRENDVFQRLPHA